MKRTLIFIYGIFCYLIGAGVYFAGLGGFLANLLGPYSVDEGQTAEIFPALLINVVLIALFGLPHSLMARPRFKRWWTRIIPPAAERSTYMLQASLMALLLIWQWRAVPPVVWSVDHPWLKVFVWGLYWLGWLIAFLATVAIDHFELTGLKQVYAYLRRRRLKPVSFKTPLLYRLVRHPMQLGVIIAFWATPEMTLGRLIFATGMTAYILIGLHFEERDLERHFGDPYRDYKERIPMLFPYKYFLAPFLLILFFLSACLPVGQGTEPTETVQAVESAMPSASAPASNATAFPSLPAMTAPAIAEPGDVPTPGNQDPVVITSDETNVRRGPGFPYEVSHVLAAGTTAPILGRNAAGDWWAVPGPGDGPGPIGWISSAVVAVEGNVSNVPILAAPPLTPEVPLMGNTGQPPAVICAVSHPGPGDTGPLYVYDGPDKQVFSVVAQLALNRWVTVIGRDNNWYHVQDAAEATGWLPVAEVAHNGLCQPDDGPGSIPLIKDPGSPPGDRCIANRPGQFPPPDIHLGPGRQFALIARLGNWAEVLQTEVGWHQVLLGPGQTGWINDKDVDLTGPCSVTDLTPTRIQFAPGETSITLEGMLEPPQRNFYLFRAFAGQRATIKIVSEFNRANFAVNGVSDGQPYKRVEGELHNWSAVLPATQDYLLTVATPADASTTGFRIILAIDPLDMP